MKRRIISIAFLGAILFNQLAVMAAAKQPTLFVPLKNEDFKNVVLLPSPTPAAILVSTPSPEPSPEPTPALTPKPTFKYLNEVSWYGPGFYGNRTACGDTYTTTTMGVANRTLPCGTLVDFRFKGKTIRVPVIDRGPYVAGREWDLSGGLCVALDHCFTGPIEYRIVR